MDEVSLEELVEEESESELDEAIVVLELSWLERSVMANPQHLHLGMGSYPLACNSSPCPRQLTIHPEAKCLGVSVCLIGCGPKKTAREDPARVDWQYNQGDDTTPELIG